MIRLLLLTGLALSLSACHNPDDNCTVSQGWVGTLVMLDGSDSIRFDASDRVPLHEPIPKMYPGMPEVDYTLEMRSVCELN